MSGFVASRVLKALLVIAISYELYIKFIMEINTEITARMEIIITFLLFSQTSWSTKQRRNTLKHLKCFCLYQLCLLLHSQFGFLVRNRENKSVMLIRNNKSVMLIWDVILRLHSVHIKRYPHTQVSSLSCEEKKTREWNFFSRLKFSLLLNQPFTAPLESKFQTDLSSPSDVFRATFKQ